jgi:hypothetical protein
VLAVRGAGKDGAAGAGGPAGVPLLPAQAHSTAVPVCCCPAARARNLFPLASRDAHSCVFAADLCTTQTPRRPRPCTQPTHRHAAPPPPHPPPPTPPTTELPPYPPPPPSPPPPPFVPQVLLSDLTYSAFVVPISIGMWTSFYAPNWTTVCDFLFGAPPLGAAPGRPPPAGALALGACLSRLAMDAAAALCVSKADAFLVLGACEHVLRHFCSPAPQRQSFPARHPLPAQVPYSSRTSGCPCTLASWPPTTPASCWS